MSKVRILILGVIVLAVLSVLWIGQTPNKKKESTPQGNGVTTVVLREGGFSPEIVTIREGDAVKFISEIDRPFWPASNKHPDHLIYSEFDPQRAIGADEEWVFVFSTPGIWHYHDHLASYLGGAVEVIAVDTSSENNCTENVYTDECIQKEITSRIRESGSDAALDYLASVFDAFSESKNIHRWCHSWTHEIGVRTYAIEGVDAKLSEKTGYCNDGFYHGFLEGFINEFPNPKMAQDFCEGIKDRFDATYPLAFGQCHHGIGHGAMEYAPSYYGIPQDRDPAQFIEHLEKFCESSSKPVSDEMYFRCVSGGLNVLRNWHRHDELGFSLEVEDPFRVCLAQESEVVKKACYWEFAKAVRHLIDDGMSPTKSYQLAIDTIKGDDVVYMPFVIESMAGRAAMQLSTYTDDTSALESCRLLPDELRLACISGHSSGLFHSSKPGMEIERTLLFCGSDLLSSEEQETCYMKTMNNVGLSYQSSNIMEICEAMPENIRGKNERCLSL